MSLAIWSRRPSGLVKSLLCTWMVFILWVALDTMTSDYPPGAFMVGSVVWRGPYETLILICLGIAAGANFKHEDLWKWFSVGCFLAFIQAMDDGWMLLFSFGGIEPFGYSPKPQHGIIVSSVIALVLLALSKRDKAVLGLMTASVAFLVFVHIVFLGGVSSHMEEKDLQRMRLAVSSSFFEGICKGKDVACYEGPWRADSAYPLTVSAPVSSFAFSLLTDYEDALIIDEQNPEQGRRIGGLIEINESAERAPMLTHAWTTGWLNRRNIDQPEKYAGYHKQGDVVRVMVNYTDPVYSRTVITYAMRSFLAVFAFVWIILGLHLIQFHRNMKPSPV